MDKVNLGWGSTCADVKKALESIENSNLTMYSTCTTIITGANTGLGKKTAEEIAKLGGVVIVACRDINKAKTAIADVMNITNDPSLKLFPLPLDLSSLTSVKEFVEKFDEASSANSWPPLKCLILNAGIVTLEGASTTGEGYEKTFAVNHLGHFLLTKLLLNTLQKNSPSRVIVLSSASHLGPLVSKNILTEDEIMKNIVNFKGTSNSDILKAYGSSKLCNVLFAQKLQELQLGVHACSLHPGAMIATEVTRGNKLLDFCTKHFLSWFTKNIDQGCSTAFLCCLAPDEYLQGRYFSDCKPAKISRLAEGENGEKARNALWSLSENLCRSYL